MASDGGGKKKAECKIPQFSLLKNVNYMTVLLWFLVLQHSKIFSETSSNISIFSQLPHRPLILVPEIYRATAAFCERLRAVRSNSLCCPCRHCAV